jgi:hypothetical protein
VDHIVPRNQGGSDDLSNLQALCFRCNAAKRWEAGCVFCVLEGSGRVLLENELALCIADAYPVSPGHSLVIPRRHGADGLALHQPEWNAVVELLKTRREQLSAQDAAISGWQKGHSTHKCAGIQGDRARTGSCRLPGTSAPLTRLRPCTTFDGVQNKG